MLMENFVWIATEKEEPAFGKEVLLCMEDSEGRSRINIGEFTRDYLYIRYMPGEGPVNLRRNGEVVTHWMPLPELPTRSRNS